MVNNIVAATTIKASIFCFTFLIIQDASEAVFQRFYNLECPFNLRCRDFS